MHNPLGNPYIHYYLGQQDGRGMPVFRGSSWQRGYGQMGYGLGGLFRSLGKIAKLMIKSGAKALGNIALTSGVNLLGNVLAGKSVKQAARTRALEGAKCFGRRTHHVFVSGHRGLRRFVKDHFGSSKANGNDLDANEKVGIVNNFLHSLFKQVDVFLKDKQVTQATGTYAYRAYMETLLNYGPAAKESQLTAAMFYKDTPGKMDVADPTIAVAANANHGLKKRYAFNQESGVIEMAGPLFCDVFKSERLLLSFVDLKVILNRNVNAFCIMSSVDDAAHKVKLTEAYLKVRKVKVSPSVSIAHELALKKEPAIYPVRRVE